MSILFDDRTAENTFLIQDFNTNSTKVHQKLENFQELIVRDKGEILGVLVDKKTYEEKEEMIKVLKGKIEYYEINSGIEKAKGSSKYYNEAEILTELNK